MTVVIDVGSATRGGWDSPLLLARQFSPRLVLGLDPDGPTRLRLRGETTIVELPFAAWTERGQVNFEPCQELGRVAETGRPVPCLDLAELVSSFDGAILKLDVEGAEKTLIPHLRRRDADLKLHLALIEHHCPECLWGGDPLTYHAERCEVDRELWAEEAARLDGLLRCDVKAWFT